MLICQYRFAVEMEKCKSWGVNVEDRRRQRVAGWVTSDDGQAWEQLPLAQPELHGARQSHGAEPEGSHRNGDQTNPTRTPCPH